MLALIRTRQHLMLTLMVIALAVRMVLPAGWMPSVANGQATITLCTGAGMVEAWVDADGKLHKEAPVKKHVGDQPCAFAGVGAATDVPAFASIALALPFIAQPALAFAFNNVAIGLGLAAPPPPAIGPPSLI